MNDERWIAVDLFTAPGKSGGEKVWGLVADPDDPGVYISVWGKWNPANPKIQQIKKIRMSSPEMWERIEEKRRKGYQVLRGWEVDVRTGKVRKIGATPTNNDPPIKPKRDVEQDWLQSDGAYSRAVI
ncbi:hypothetical protein [Thioalkalivibrio sp. ALE16]|uniref:hypothetical protein n=1 Tax=Thioalkalivibrio sp. ALE16 TaxID=1158172 RepID=UPI0012DD227D|nr:hypothetical protein [Thioalkalivibrio sp. ALE16]